MFNNQIAQNLALVVVSILLTLFVSEALLRALHIPEVSFNTIRYDDIVGYAHYPGVRVLYSNSGGDYIERLTNSIGFLDKEHNKEKLPGVYRIGFFGDSFTEARQVPLEQTFFRLSDIGLGDGVETFSFGVAGYSTLQSYLTSKRWAEDFNLDMAVYVFFGNDMGDNMREVKQMQEIPYPLLENGELGIDTSFNQSDYFLDRQKMSTRAVKYLTARSLVASTVLKRARVLFAQDLGNDAKEGSGASEFPNQNDAPSLWPQDLRQKATLLGESIIRQWRDDLEGKGIKYAILYIPAEEELTKDIAEQDSWQKWLGVFSGSENIPLIDPTSVMREASLNNKEVFYDHLTSEGHRAVSSVFNTWFLRN